MAGSARAASAADSSPRPTWSARSSRSARMEDTSARAAASSAVTSVSVSCSMLAGSLSQAMMRAAA